MPVLRTKMVQAKYVRTRL